MLRDSLDLLAVNLPGCPSTIGPRFLKTSYPSTTLFTTKEHAFKSRCDATEKKHWCWIQHLQWTEFLQLVNVSMSYQNVMDSSVLMLAIRLWEHSFMYNKATIRRWVSAVQEHTGLHATQIPILGFPQCNKQKRHCCTNRHKFCKPIDANKTPQMASRFYLRPHLLCCLILWDRFTSSCFVVPQSPALESSLAP